MLDLKPAVLLTPDDPKWMNFLSASADASIFHHPAWSQLLTNCYGYRPFVIAWVNIDGTIGAGVPFMGIKSLVTGRRWVSLPFSDYCSPLWENQTALKGLLESIILLASEEKVSEVELRGTYLDSSNLHIYSDHVLHEVELGPNVDTVMAHLHEMHRRNIKTALANNIRIVQGETQHHIEEFYNLHLHTRRNQGVPIQPWSFFKELKRILLDQGLGFLLLAYKNQQCIAGAIFLHWQKTLTYKYGASLPEGLKFRPNNLIIWTAMQWGCINGFTRFDLGRTSFSNQGLRTFKSRWGAQESPLKYASLTPRSDKEHYGKLMDLTRGIIQKAPLWVCRFTGEILYKHFG